MSSDLTSRKGSFSLPAELIQKHPLAVQEALHGAIVIRAEHHYWTNGIEYGAVHPDFELVAEGCSPNRYQPVFDYCEPHADGRPRFLGWLKMESPG